MLITDSSSEQENGRLMIDARILMRTKVARNGSGAQVKSSAHCPCCLAHIPVAIKPAFKAELRCHPVSVR